MTQSDLARAVSAAFELDAWVNPHRDHIDLRIVGGTVILTGEVAEISAKRRAYYAALDVAGVAGVEDRLTVSPAEQMGDDEIGMHFGKVFSEDLAFKHYNLTILNRKGERVIVRQLEEEGGHLLVYVQSGAVHLEGKVRALCDRRLTEVLAWWIPGSRNVVNDLKVVPPEEDNDDQLREAILLAWDVDPFLDPQQLDCRSQNGEVLLTGFVTQAEQVKLAEHDCWFVEGVKKVDNRLTLT